MSLLSNWFASALAFATDSQNTPEINLLNTFEAIEIDIPTIEAAEIQIKGSNLSGGTFDIIGLEEPIPSSTGGFRTTVPLGGRYQFIKVHLSVAQTADRVFAVRGISYASGGLVALLDKVKELLSGIAKLVPLAKASQHGVAEALNTDILAADLSPTNTPCLFRTMVVLETSGVFSAILKNGGVSKILKLNGAVALAANCAYSFDILVHSGDTVNYQTDTSGNVTLRVQEIVGATQ